MLPTLYRRARHPTTAREGRGDAHLRMQPRAVRPEGAEGVVGAACRAAWWRSNGGNQRGDDHAMHRPTTFRVSVRRGAAAPLLAASLCLALMLLAACGASSSAQGFPTPTDI